MELRPTKLVICGKRVWLQDDEDGTIRRKLEYDVLEAGRPPMLTEKRLLTDEENDVVIVD